MNDTLFGKVPSWDDRFESFWKDGIFRKLGKLEARRHLRGSIKGESDWMDLERAHEAYKADLERNPRPLLHGSTFCHQWRDFLGELTIPAKPTRPELEAQEILRRPDKPVDWDKDWAREFLNSLKDKK